MNKWQNFSDEELVALQYVLSSNPAGAFSLGLNEVAAKLLKEIEEELKP